MRWPSGENAACPTLSVWPSSLAMVSSWPLAAFHTRAVLSALAVTMRWHSNITAHPTAEWPLQRVRRALGEELPAGF